jgi:hypothetical protein
VFFNPAASSMPPSIVDDDELVAANSGLWSAAVISQIALAPLAGAVVAAVGVSPAFLVNAPSFAVSALLLARLVSPRRPALVFGPLLRGVVDLVLASTRSLAVAMGALAVYGVGTSTGAVYYLGGVLLVAGVIGFAGLPPSTIRHGNGEPAAR